MSAKPTQLNSHNYRLFNDDARNLLFHVPSSSLFELEDDDEKAIRNLEKTRNLKGQDKDFVASLEKLDIIGKGQISKDIEVKNLPATTLILNIASGCNLSCTYCYKEDLTTLKNSGNMTFEIAKEAINQLHTNTPNQPLYTITFFGGEPLSNFPLIKDVVLYANDFFKKHKAKVDYNLTTNGTLLNETIIDFFKKYRIGLTLSMDGPKDIHDKTRLTNAQKGTYDIVSKKAKLLLNSYKSRPIGARVTLTRGITDVVRIWDHLFNEMGFNEVGFAPATSSDSSIFNLTEKELLKVFEGFKVLGNDYVEAALKNRFNGFSNIHRIISDIHFGTKKSLPCGAGVGLLSVSYSGSYDLCHRFTGSDFPSFGNIQQGLDKIKLTKFIEKRANNQDISCQTCHIRNFCAGGCYHESYIKYGNPLSAVLHYCDIMRDWIDFGIVAYAKIKDKNPKFIETYFKEEKGARSETL